MNAAYLNGAAAGVEADTAVGEVNEVAVVDVEQRRRLAELGYRPAQLQGFRVSGKARSFDPVEPGSWPSLALEAERYSL
jgi:hypothetical protein